MVPNFVRKILTKNVFSKKKVGKIVFGKYFSKKIGNQFFFSVIYFVKSGFVFSRNFSPIGQTKLVLLGVSEGCKNTGSRKNRHRHSISWGRFRVMSFLIFSFGSELKYRRYRERPTRPGVVFFITNFSIIWYSSKLICIFRKGPEKNFGCSKCDSKYISLYLLTQHYGSNHEQKKFRCPKCLSHEYKYETGLQRHLTTNHTDLTLPQRRNIIEAEKKRNNYVNSYEVKEKVLRGYLPR